jgi:hypothetical protein
MSLVLLFIIIASAAIGYGVWRRFTAIQWIWLLFGTCAVLMLLWLVLVVFVIGPQMRRMIQFGN